MHQRPSRFGRRIDPRYRPWRGRRARPCWRSRRGSAPWTPRSRRRGGSAVRPAATRSTHGGSDGRARSDASLQPTARRGGVHGRHGPADRRLGRDGGRFVPSRSGSAREFRVDDSFNGPPPPSARRAPTAAAVRRPTSAPGDGRAALSASRPAPRARTAGSRRGAPCVDT